MRKKFWTTASILAVVFATGANAQKIDWNIFAEPFVSAAHAQDINWQQVDDVLGRKPAVAGDVHRYGFPRSDLSVTLDGVTIKPALALGGWVAFKPAHGGAMVMGDLVLLDSEINPVMADSRRLLRRTPNGFLTPMNSRSATGMVQFRTVKTAPISLHLKAGKPPLLWNTVLIRLDTQPRPKADS